MLNIKSFGRREISFLLVLITGTFMILQYYINSPEMKYTGKQILVWNTIIIAWVAFIGLSNATTRYYRSFMKNTKISEKFLSAYFLILLYGSIILGLWTGLDDGLYPWIYNNAYGGVRIAVNALPALYLFTAALRGFIAKNKESALFLIAGLLVLMVNAPIGEAIWGGFKIIGNFILDVPMMGFQRAMTLTVGVGIVAYCIRVLLGASKEGAEDE